MGGENEQQINQQGIRQQGIDGLPGELQRAVHIISSQGLAHQGGQPHGKSKGRHKGNGLYGKDNIAYGQFDFSQSADQKNKKGKG